MNNNNNNNTSLKHWVKMNCRPIQGMFPLYEQCFQDRLRIYRDPEQDKAVTESE